MALRLECCSFTFLLGRLVILQEPFTVGTGLVLFYFVNWDVSAFLSILNCEVDCMMNLRSLHSQPAYFWICALSYTGNTLYPLLNTVLSWADFQPSAYPLTPAHKIFRLLHVWIQFWDSLGCAFHFYIWREYFCVEGHALSTFDLSLSVRWSWMRNIGQVHWREQFCIYSRTLLQF